MCNHPKDEQPNQVQGQDNLDSFSELELIRKKIADQVNE